MTNYRLVARHVRYWRGALHKWSTVYPFVGTLTSAQYPAAITALHDCEQAVNYAQTGVTKTGGLYEIALYNQSSGGVPQAVSTYFDPTAPAGWIAYTGSAWSSVTIPIETGAEVALDVKWLAGLSSSGKPVAFRKWFHAVPQSSAGAGAVDVSPTNVTSLGAALHTMTAAIAALGAPMGSGGRLAATTAVVAPYYGNHQMPRGRKKKVVAASVGSRFPASVLIVPGSDGSLGS